MADGMSVLYFWANAADAVQASEITATVNLFMALSVAAGFAQSQSAIDDGVCGVVLNLTQVNFARVRILSGQAAVLCRGTHVRFGSIADMEPFCPRLQCAALLPTRMLKPASGRCLCGAIIGVVATIGF